MRTINEIIGQDLNVLFYELKIAANESGLWKANKIEEFINDQKKTIQNLMQEYTCEVIDYLTSNSEDYIYIDDGEGGDYSRPEEAVFNYEAIEKLKQELK